MIDVDSFVGEVRGRLKQGPAHGYTHVLGYYPILATRADTRETLHIRLRKGSANTQRGCCASPKNWSPAWGGPARPWSSCCAPTLGSGHPGLRALGAGGLAVLDRVRMIKSFRAAVEAIEQYA